MEKNKTEIYLKVNKTAKTRNKPNNNKLQSLVAASSAAGAKRGLLFAIRQNPTQPQTDQLSGGGAGLALDRMDRKVVPARESQPKVCTAESASNATMKLEICHELQTISDRQAGPANLKYFAIE